MSNPLCSILGGLSGQLGSGHAASAQRGYGLNRLAGVINLANGIVHGSVNVSINVNVPSIDAATYARLGFLCPGTFPALPADAAAALALLQAALNAGSLADQLQANPLSKLNSLHDTLDQIASAGTLANVTSSIGKLVAPGAAGAIAAKAGAALLGKTAALATHRAASALGSLGINPVGLARCIAKQCAGGN